jgi:hypothetical protein
MRTKKLRDRLSNAQCIAAVTYISVGIGPVNFACLVKSRYVRFVRYPLKAQSSKSDET